MDEKRVGRGALRIGSSPEGEGCAGRGGDEATPAGGGDMLYLRAADLPQHRPIDPVSVTSWSLTATGPHRGWQHRRPRPCHR